MSNDIVKNDRELDPPPDAVPRRSVRINKGKAPQHLEDYILPAKLRKKQEKSVRTKKKSITRVELVGRLLPGIPDDNTLTVIAPKLSWRDVCTFCSVTRGWRQAIVSREVYNERVSTGSTETLAVIHQMRPGSRQMENEFDPQFHVLSLCSARENYKYDLPPIPFYGGIPSASQHVSLDGKVYVLGGRLDPIVDLASKQVYVLDLTGQGQWKPCARMHHARQCFGAGVVNGKIYVFGGRSLHNFVYACEVYDPKIDVWSPIKSLVNGRLYHRVAAVGEEIALYGGIVPIPGPVSVDFYHPVKNDWRLIEPASLTRNWEGTFVAQGTFYKIIGRDIFVFDIGRNCWRRRHLFLDNPGCRFRDGFYQGLQAVVLGDEVLFAGVFSNCCTGLHDCCLFQTNGFGKERQEIALKNVQCSVFLDLGSSFACDIQL